MNRRFLSVPLNETGRIEYNLGVEKSSNIYSIELPENEFKSLTGLFNLFNDEFNLFIDDYESEIIESAQLLKRKKDIENMRTTTPCFYEAANKAIEQSSMLALDF